MPAGASKKIHSTVERHKSFPGKSIVRYSNQESVTLIRSFFHRQERRPKSRNHVRTFFSGSPLRSVRTFLFFVCHFHCHSHIWNEVRLYMRITRYSLSFWKMRACGNSRFRLRSLSFSVHRRSSPFLGHGSDGYSFKSRDPSLSSYRRSAPLAPYLPSPRRETQPGTG